MTQGAAHPARREMAVPPWLLSFVNVGRRGRIAHVVLRKLVGLSMMEIGAPLVGVAAVFVVEAAVIVVVDDVLEGLVVGVALLL